MRASDVTPRAVDWLWFPYVPEGKITLLAGQMGQAKSLATAWLTAAVTTGEGINSRPGSVLFLNAEDDPEDTTRPRLEAAGADLDKVWLEPKVSLQVDVLANLCDEAKDVRLITVDPIGAYYGTGVNSWKSQDVRAVCEPLRLLAKERRLAVVLVQHLNRRSDAGDALSRIADSQGIAQLARSVLVWGPDPADPEGDQGVRKAMTRAKGNLARSNASATFSIAERIVTGGINAPYLTRGDDATITSEDVVADRETRTATDEAVDFLRDLLADGPVAAKEGTARANEVGIATRTLKNAKSRLGVRSAPARGDKAITGWTWELPEKTLCPLASLPPSESLEGNSATRQEVPA